MVLVYEMIGRLFSRAQMRKLGSFLDSSGMSLVPEAFAGFMVLLCMLCSVLLYGFLISYAYTRGLLFRVAMVVSTDMTANSSLFFTSIAVVIAIVLAVVAICLSAYVILSMMAGSRKQKVEDVLPDFLSLSASNMRAGMTIDQAMWYAAKPEFGILSVEVATVAKRAFGGVPFNQAIDSLPDKFDSKSLRRAVSLIKQGLASGGKLAEILEQTAEESRQIRILRKDIASSLMMYVIFIVFAGAIGTPFLFAISGQLVAMIEHIFLTLPQTSSTTTSAFGSSFAMPNKTVVSSADFYLFTLLCSAVTAIFSALIIGVISHGSKREGILYIPVLLIISFTIFFLIGTAIEGFLAGIAGG